MKVSVPYSYGNYGGYILYEYEDWLKLTQGWETYRRVLAAFDRLKDVLMKLKNGEK